MRGRATGRLCMVIRGVVSDADPCLFNGVICDLPFNVVSLPIKGDSIIAHPPVICQPLPHDFFRNICDYEILNGHIPQGFRRRGRRRYAEGRGFECLKINQEGLYMLYCICCACVHARMSFPLCKSLKRCNDDFGFRAECMTKEPRLNLSPPAKPCSAAPPTGGVGGHHDLRDYGTGVSPDE